MMKVVSNILYTNKITNEKFVITVCLNIIYNFHVFVCEIHATFMFTLIYMYVHTQNIATVKLKDKLLSITIQYVYT